VISVKILGLKFLRYIAEITSRIIEKAESNDPALGDPGIG